MCPYIKKFKLMRLIYYSQISILPLEKSNFSLNRLHSIWISIKRKIKTDNFFFLYKENVYSFKKKKDKNNSAKLKSNKLLKRR